MLLLLLLLLLASQSSAHVSFRDFSSNRRPTGVKFDTGYNLNTVEAIWEKYGRRLIRAVENGHGGPQGATTTTLRRPGPQAAIL